MRAISNTRKSLFVEAMFALFLIVALLVPLLSYGQQQGPFSISGKNVSINALDNTGSVALVSPGKGSLKFDSSSDVTAQGQYGETFTVTNACTSVTLSGATTAATSLIPEDSIVHGCTVIVTTLITGATSWDLGDGSDADKWGDNEALTVGTRTGPSEWTSTAHPLFYATAVSPLFTAVGADFTAGAVRICCSYTTMTAPTN